MIDSKHGAATMTLLRLCVLLLAVSASAYAARTAVAEEKPNRVERAAKKTADGAERTARRTGNWAERTARRTGNWAERTGRRAGNAARRTAERTDRWIQERLE